jgi:hypothetical protein
MRLVLIANMKIDIHIARISKSSLGEVNPAWGMIKSNYPQSLRKLSDQCGSSLVEIMISVLILSFVSIGMAEFFANGRVGFDREEHKRVATLLAQEALERTVVQSYPEIGPWSEQRTIDSRDYTIAVSTFTNTPEIGLKTVQSDVTWFVTSSDTRAVSLVTFVNEI